MPLRDPDLPAHAIVKETDDGGAIRNDGTVLKPASRNVWALLATVHGEQEGEGLRDINTDLAARNRRIWNGWACSALDDAARAELAKKLKLPVAELAPLSDAERALAEAHLRDTLGPDAALPDPETPIELSATYFAHTRGWEKYVFSGYADFQDANFGRLTIFQDATFGRFAIFRDATFNGDAFFQNANFSGYADFRDATFNGVASFGNATFSRTAVFKDATFGRFGIFRGAAFSRDAIFRDANFSGPADFRDATFSGPAVFWDATFGGHAAFGDATFSQHANFRSARFETVTVFRNARFQKHAPAFHAAALYQDTRFTTDARMQDSHWPAPAGDTAEDSKSAYVRLRQIMAELHKPDDEHFFFRQEMRCEEVLRSGPDRWIVALFRLFSDFGFSVARPALWLLGTVMVGGLLLTVAFAWERVIAGAARGVPEGFALSFANTFAFLGFNRLYFGAAYMADLPVWARVLGAGQTVAGLVFLFFLGLGLRTRFRLR